MVSICYVSTLGDTANFPSPKKSRLSATKTAM
jgi:hypothetical protein